MVQAPERAATAIASSRAAHESARMHDVARRTAEPTQGPEKDGRRARARCRMPKRSAAPRAAAATPRCAARPRPARPAAARPRRPPRRPGTRGGTPASPAACRAVARPRRHQPSPACATRRHRLTMEGCLRSARAPLQHDDSKVWFAHLLQPSRRHLLQAADIGVQPPDCIERATHKCMTMAYPRPMPTCLPHRLQPPCGRWHCTGLSVTGSALSQGAHGSPAPPPANSASSPTRAPASAASSAGAAASPGPRPSVSPLASSTGPPAAAALPGCSTVPGAVGCAGGRAAQERASPWGGLRIAWCAAPACGACTAPALAAALAAAACLAGTGGRGAASRPGGLAFGLAPAAGNAGTAVSLPRSLAGAAVAAPAEPAARPVLNPGKCGAARACARLGTRK